VFLNNLLSPGQSAAPAHEEDYARSDERFAADGSELYAVFAAVSLRLSRIPAMIKLKVTAANK